MSAGPAAGRGRSFGFTCVCPECLGVDAAVSSEATMADAFERLVDEERFPDDDEPAGELFARARAARISQDYFLMWDIADLLRETVERTWDDERTRLRAGILVALVEERIEAVIEQARAAAGAAGAEGGGDGHL